MKLKRMHTIDVIAVQGHSYKNFSTQKFVNTKICHTKIHADLWQSVLGLDCKV